MVHLCPSLSQPEPRLGGWSASACGLRRERANNPPHLNKDPELSRAPPHILHHHIHMKMWRADQGEFDHLTPEGYTAIDAFSTPNGVGSYSPSERRLVKYYEDPPALIACVAHLSHGTRAMTNRLVQRDGSYRERENDGKEDHPSDSLLPTPTLTNTITVREPSEQLQSRGRGRPRFLHIRDPGVWRVHHRWSKSHSRRHSGIRRHLQERHGCSEIDRGVSWRIVG